MDKATPDSSICPRLNENTAFAIALIALFLVSVYIIWATRYLPMQDYPQHLYISHVLASADRPGTVAHDYYVADLRPGPYTLFYLFAGYVAKFMPAMAAGKLFLSLYLGLVAVLPYHAWRRLKPASPPWTGLLLMPLAFNQTYYLGFVDYLISVPLLMLCLVQHMSLPRGASRGRSYMPLAAGLAMLCFTHPYTILVFIVLSTAGAVLAARDPAVFRQRIAWPGLMVLVYAAWHLGNPANTGLEVSAGWWPLKSTLNFFLLMFTGMKITSGPDHMAAALWTLCALVIGLAALKRRSAMRNPLALYAALAMAGYLVLPYTIGRYSYFNVRMAPVACMALVLATHGIGLGRRSAAVMALAAALLLLQTGAIHRTFSAEAREIEPVIDKVPNGAHLLPIVFESTGSAVDDEVFYQIHANDNFYIALEKDAVGARLLANPFIPVALRPDKAPPRLSQWYRGEDGGFYEFIATRGAPESAVSFVTQRGYSEVVASGRWKLFRKKAP